MVCQDRLTLVERVEALETSNQANQAMMKEQREIIRALHDRIKIQDAIATQQTATIMQLQERMRAMEEQLHMSMEDILSHQMRSDLEMADKVTAIENYVKAINASNETVMAAAQKTFRAAEAMGAAVAF